MLPELWFAMAAEEKKLNEGRELTKIRGDLIMGDIRKWNGISPSMLLNKATRGLWDAFDNSETEASALWVLRLQTKRGNWGPFSVKSLSNLYHEKYPDEDFCWNWLIYPGLCFGFNPATFRLVADGWCL